MRQSKTLSTIDERGSEIATTSVFDCQWSPVGRLMAIEKSASNYFWSTFVDNIDVFDCHQSGVNSLYASLCFGVHFCIQLNKIIWNWKVYNNDDITFFSARPSCDNVLQPSPLRGSGCNTLPHSGLANVNIRKRMFYPLIVYVLTG